MRVLNPAPAAPPTSMGAHGHASVSHDRNGEGVARLCADGDATGKVHAFVHDAVNRRVPVRKGTENTEMRGGE